MKFLAIEKELNGSPIPAELLAYEAEKVWDFYTMGKIREIYFDNKNCTVLILECGDDAEAEEVLSRLPLVQNKFISFEISKLNPYTGFSRLMK